MDISLSQMLAAAHSHAEHQEDAALSMCLSTAFWRTLLIHRYSSVQSGPLKNF